MKRLCLLLPLFALAACASHPAPDLWQDARMKVLLSRKAEPLPLRVTLAPLRLGFDPASLARAPKATHRLPKDLEAFRAELAEALVRTRAFAEVRTPAPPGGEGGFRSAALADAWDRGDDAVLFATLRRFENTWEGSNGLFLPNLLLWMTFLFPSYWVADERYGARVEMDLELVSVHSRKTVARTSIESSTVRDLDDFDRGWQLAGILRVPGSLEEENWASVSEVVSPYALHDATAALAAWCGGPLRKAFETEAFQRSTRKTLAVIAGLSKHETYALHNIRYARRDAEAVWRALVERGGLPERNARLLLDERATAANLRSAVETFVLPRARQGDTVLFYFAGYGGLGPGRGGSDAYLLPYDYDPRKPLAASALGLSYFRNEMEKCAASRVVFLLDTSFGSTPEGRSADRGRAEGASEILASLARGRRGAALFAGAGPSEKALEFEDKSQGLFTFYLAGGLEGQADADADGAVTLSELASYVTERVEKRSLMQGETQRPVLFHEEAGGAVLARPAREEKP